MITRVDPTRADGLVPGDIVVSINGKAAEAFILEVESAFSGIGDPGLRRAAALDFILVSNSLLILRVLHRLDPPYYYNLQPDCAV